MSKTKFKQTEIGEIPIDWDVVALKDVADVNSETIDKKYAFGEIGNYGHSGIFWVSSN